MRGGPPPGMEDYNPRKGGGSFGESVTEEHRALALQGWCRVASGLHLKPEHEEAISIVNGATENPDLHIRPYTREVGFSFPQRDYRQVKAMVGPWMKEKRALSILAGTAGMYTIPQGFVNNLEIALLQYANVRQVADVMRTETGADLPWPSVNDVNNKGSVITENTTVSPVDPVFGQVMFHAFKYTSNLILVPVELLEDSAFDLAEYIGNLAGIRIGRIQADHFTFGDGAGKCTGFMQTATAGLTFASSTGFTFDEVYSLKHSVDPAYRANSPCWMCHDQTLAFLKKLKDGAGRYLYQGSVAEGAPATLDGDPILINQSMDQIASGKKSLVYGDFSRFKIRDVNQIRLRRLIERYADADQEGFVMFMRSDSKATYQNYSAVPSYNTSVPCA